MFGNVKYALMRLWIITLMYLVTLLHKCAKQGWKAAQTTNVSSYAQVMMNVGIIGRFVVLLSMLVSVLIVVRS